MIPTSTHFVLLTLSKAEKTGRKPEFFVRKPLKKLFEGESVLKRQLLPIKIPLVLFAKRPKAERQEPY